MASKGTYTTTHQYSEPKRVKRCPTISRSATKSNCTEEPRSIQTALEYGNSINNHWTMAPCHATSYCIKRNQLPEMEQSDEQPFQKEPQGVNPWSTCPKSTPTRTDQAYRKPICQTLAFRTILMQNDPNGHLHRRRHPRSCDHVHQSW